MALPPPEYPKGTRDVFRNKAPDSWRLFGGSHGQVASAWHWTAARSTGVSARRACASRHRPVNPMKIRLAAILALLATRAMGQGALPDSVRTPGALNPMVTQETIGSTICVRGWTRTVRPSPGYTSALKRQQVSEFGYADQKISEYEEDHLIPLILGGSPDDARNLWPEPFVSADGWRADRKDELETVLARLVCAGRLPLADAQRMIATDWTAAFGQYVTGRRDWTCKPTCSGLQAAYAQTPGYTPPAGMTCPGDKLVWVNTRSGVYHFQGEHYFGSTKRGKFICERDADAEGDRPTRS